MIYHCCEENRRALVDAHPSLNGIDHLEVLDLDAPPGSVEWIRIRPGTDTAAMLAMATELLRAGRHDDAGQRLVATRREPRAGQLGGQHPGRLEPQAEDGAGDRWLLGQQPAVGPVDTDHLLDAHGPVEVRHPSRVEGTDRDLGIDD